eukprot:Sdes_comp19247_c0_seq1m10196
MNKPPQFHNSLTPPIHWNQPIQNKNIVIMPFSFIHPIKFGKKTTLSLSKFLLKIFSFFFFLLLSSNKLSKKSKTKNISRLTTQDTPFPITTGHVDPEPILLPLYP